ncbi:MAG TPA: hybrid sensor histidine kinase/response regulator [Candidatus Paceibacterota bacterium]|nr:hybrid sensor histidine kinase/response regulator [Candidatus Paceibacterota bacterium]
MRKILVIDDEEWLREMIQLALRQHGFEVIEAENGEKGIAVAKKELPDLILCDVNMDKVDGYSTLSALRSESSTATIPFILMTGLADQAGMRHGMELGADDYLPKPFTIDALYAAVDIRLKKVNVVRQEAEKKLADLRENISMMLPHELRTPLNGILAYGEILNSDAESLQPAEISEMGQVIYQSGKRLEHLVENFLIFAQLELLGTDPQKLQSLLRKQTQSPAALIEHQARDQAHTFNRSDDIFLEIADVPVPMSEEYLGKIVSELVQNGLKFSQAGSPVQVTLVELPNRIVLTVTDRGRGLSVEHIAKIGAYMQFDRKMHEQQGLGLGLTICKRLTELHGGTLTIQSNVGTGTVVTVKLPKALSF